MLRQRTWIMIMKTRHDPNSSDYKIDDARVKRYKSDCACTNRIVYFKLT